MSSGKNKFESIMSVFYFYAFMFLLKYKTRLLKYME